MSEQANKPIAAKENEEALVDALFAKRESVDLNKQNARFSLSDGGLISLELSLPGKEKEFFERVVIIRAYPITNPYEFLVVRSVDSKEHGKGEEIGIIRDLNLMTEDEVKIISAELDKRYFIPEITKVMSVKDKYGLSYWECETSAGHRSFIVSNPYVHIRLLEDGRLIIEDMDGSNYCISNIAALDKLSQKKIEVFC